MGDAPAKDNGLAQGGQAAAPGLFGLPGNGGLFARRSPQARTPAQSQGDDTAARVGGLTSGQRRARLQARLGVGVANFTRTAAAGEPVAALLPPPVLSMDALMAKYRRKAKVPPLTGLDAAEQASIARYLESLERDEEERQAREGTHAAMLAFAHASDMREAFPCHFDEEAAEIGFAADCPAHDPALAQD